MDKKKSYQLAHNDIPIVYKMLFIFWNTLKTQGTKFIYPTSDTFKFKAFNDFYWTFHVKNKVKFIYENVSQLMRSDTTYSTWSYYNNIYPR